MKILDMHCTDVQGVEKKRNFFSKWNAEKDGATNLNTQGNSATKFDNPIILSTLISQTVATKEGEFWPKINFMPMK